MQELSIGIDIGGTNTSFGFVSSKGTIHFQHSIATQSYPNIESFVNQLFIEIEKGKQTLQTEKNISLKGIGIGAPNSNFYTGTIENAPNLPWKGTIELVKMMKQHYKTPIFLNNDANVVALGEMVFGGAKSMKNFISITLGTGLGGGIVANGKLINGHHSAGGEVGHFVVKKNGRVCNCGQKGCLETYVSATALVRTAYKLLAKYNIDSELRNLAFEKTTAKKIAEFANCNDFIALKAFKQTAKILGESLAKIASIIDPEAIFLFGGLAKSEKLLFENTRFYFNKNALNPHKNKVAILPSALKENAAILGAAAMTFYDF